MTALQCSLELALSYDQTIEEYRTSIEAALANAERLRTRLSFLRDLAEASGAGDPAAHTELAELLEEVRQELLPLFESAGREIAIHCPCVEVRGEPRRLRRGFIYLLEYLQREAACERLVTMTAAALPDRVKIEIAGLRPAMDSDLESAQMTIARRTFEALGGELRYGTGKECGWRIDLLLAPLVSCNSGS